MAKTIQQIYNDFFFQDAGKTILDIADYLNAPEIRRDFPYQDSGKTLRQLMSKTGVPALLNSYAFLSEGQRIPSIIDYYRPTGTPLSIPAAFRNQNLGYNIYEKGRIYQTDYNFDSKMPSGVEKYINCVTGNDTTGTGTRINPYKTAAKAWAEGATVVLAQDTGGVRYKKGDGFAAGFNPNRDVAIISIDGPGKAIFTKEWDAPVWVQEDAPNQNAWSATIANCAAVVDLTAPASVDPQGVQRVGIDGLPIRPQNSIQTSVANVHANAGSQYFTGTTVTVRTWDDRMPDANIIVISTDNFLTLTNTNVKLYMKDIEFWGRGVTRTNLASVTNTNILTARNCAARYSNFTGVGSLSGTGYSETYLENCQASDHATSDGFSYAATEVKTRCKALEVNCQAWSHGAVEGNNFNSFTSHNEASVVRLNGIGDSTYGPICADVLGSHCINLGLDTGNSLVATNTGQRVAMQSGGESDFAGAAPTQVWSKNCTSRGVNYSRCRVGAANFYDMGGHIDLTNLKDYSVVNGLSIQSYP